MSRGCLGCWGRVSPVAFRAVSAAPVELSFSSDLAEANATVDGVRRSVALQTLPTKLTHKTLSESIATALEDVEGYHLASTGERFGLAPQVDEGYEHLHLSHLLKLAGQPGVSGELKT